MKNISMNKKEKKEFRKLEDKTFKVAEPQSTADANALSEHGIKPIYELNTKSSKSINTTAQHPYFVKATNFEDLISDDLNLPSSINSIKNPSKSVGLDLFLSSLENAVANASGLSWGISTKTTENTFSLENSTGLVKSESLVTNIRPSDLEIYANLPSGNLFGARITSNPSDLRNLPTRALTFSSNRNLSSERDVDCGNVSTSGQISSVLQSSSDMGFGQGREIFDNFFSGHSAFQHLQDLPDHDSCALESGLAVANFAVSNDVLVDLDSHKTNNNNEIYKDIENEIKKWIEVRHLKIGDEIAVPDYETNTINWEKITSIETLEPQHVYNPSIEGALNFMVNNITANNACLSTNKNCLKKVKK